MASASFVEIISHFAGDLKIFEDIARHRIEYGKASASRPSDDYSTPRPDYDHSFTRDDMDVASGRAPAPMPDNAIDFVRALPVGAGGDRLANHAAIVDVNPDNAYVNGHVYTDTILVQANLFPVHQDQAVNADTHALVPELIAFVNDGQDHTHATPTCMPALHRARGRRWEVDFDDWKGAHR